MPLDKVGVLLLTSHSFAYYAGWRKGRKREERKKGEGGGKAHRQRAPLWTEQHNALWLKSSQAH